MEKNSIGFELLRPENTSVFFVVKRLIPSVNINAYGNISFFRKDEYLRREMLQSHLPH
jgi:hypothetical protein